MFLAHAAPANGCMRRLGYEGVAERATLAGAAPYTLVRSGMIVVPGDWRNAQFTAHGERILMNLGTVPRTRMTLKARALTEGFVQTKTSQDSRRPWQALKMHFIRRDRMAFDAMWASYGYFYVSHSCQNCWLGVDGSLHVVRGFWASVHKSAH